MVPNSEAALSISILTSAISLKSPETAMHFGLCFCSSESTASSAVLFLPEITTLAFNFAKVIAMSLPIPLLPPVTTTVLFSNSEK